MVERSHIINTEIKILKHTTTSIYTRNNLLVLFGGVHLSFALISQKIIFSYFKKKFLRLILTSYIQIITKNKYHHLRVF